MNIAKPTAIGVLRLAMHIDSATPGGIREVEEPRSSGAPWSLLLLVAIAGAFVWATLS